MWNEHLEKLDLVPNAEKKTVKIYKLNECSVPPGASVQGYWKLYTPAWTSLFVGPGDCVEINLQLAVVVPDEYMVYIPYTQLDKHVFAMQVQTQDPYDGLRIVVYNYSPDVYHIQPQRYLVNMWVLVTVSHSHVTLVMAE